LLPPPIALTEESDDVDTSEYGWVDAEDRLEAVLLPVTHGSWCRAGRLRGLADIVRAAPLKAADTMSAICHR
jgi:hypothetical protein